MLTTELHITFSMVWAIVVANIAVAVLLMFWSKQVAKVAFVPGHLLVPGVILFVFMGAWLGGASLGDWISCITMGIVGFIMKRGGWPRPPLILALILGSIMENAFQISMGAHDGAHVTRDLVCNTARRPRAHGRRRDPGAGTPEAGGQGAGVGPGR